MTKALNAMPPRVVVSEKLVNGVWLLIVTCCPFCKKRHTHGGGSGLEPGLYGHREAHCVEGEGSGYELVSSYESILLGEHP